MIIISLAGLHNRYSRITCLLVSLALLTLTTVVAAQDYEAGKQAYLAKDYEQALDILEPLARRGNSDAQIMLGLMYDYGHGVGQDTLKAIDWYTRAANQGRPVVQHDLGVKYFQGKGIERDYLQAARWWEQAARAGLADSQFNLGLMYYRGLGLRQDFDRASELFLNAAEQGHANAQYSLAIMHAFSHGVPRDYGQALNWFRQAAEQGIAQAQYNLGVFYENGYGTDVDLRQARHWYQKAAAQDVDKARERLATLGEQGTEDIIATNTGDNARETPAESRQPGMPEVSVEPLVEQGLRLNNWVRQKASNHYTLQLISLTDEQAVADYLRQQGLDGHRSGYIEVNIDGITRYSALHGEFDNHASAQAAIETLPEAVQRDSPWVRNFGVLQKLLQ